MQKYLLPLLALTLGLGASAQTLQEIEPVMAKASQTRAEETWKDLGEGEFSDFVLSNLFYSYLAEPIKVQVQESEQTPGRYRVVNPWPSITTHPELNYLIIDASDPEYVKIPEQQSPADDPNLGETWYCSYTYFITDLKGIPKETFKELQPKMVPVLKDGVISFDRNSMAVMWKDGNAGQGVAPGDWTYGLMQSDGYLQLPGAQGQGSDWDSLGTGRMLEGFVWTLFEEDAPKEKEVEIFESRTTPGIYRIAKAFADISSTGGDMIIDCTDPDFCRIRKQSTGVKAVDYGTTYIFSVSMNGTFADYDDMVAQYPEWADRNITKDNKGIYIPATSVLIYWPEYDEVNVIKNTRSIDSYIYFPQGGVEHIESISDNTKTEYYTLQGVRIATPEKGQIVIVRNGAKATKTTFR